jgi:hypothetical protein
MVVKGEKRIVPNGMMGTIQLWLGSLKERYRMEGIGINEEENIKTDHKEIGWKYFDWICLAQDRD